MPMRHPLRNAAIGAFVFAATQYVLLATAPGTASLESTGWFLNTRTSAVLMLGILAVASGLLTATTALSVVQTASAFAAGAAVAMAVGLFIIGPGNLFPIVIAIGTACITVASFAGAAVGGIVRSMIRPRRS